MKIFNMITQLAVLPAVALGFAVTPSVKPASSTVLFSEHATNWNIGSIAANPGGTRVRCEGESRRTFDFNDLTRETIQCSISTEGRPLEAAIQVWIGPDWTPYKINCYSDDGFRFPVQTLIGTRSKTAQLELRNTQGMAMPFVAACSYAPESLEKIRSEIPETQPEKEVRVQGGAISSQPLPECDQVRVFLKTDTRMLNARVELLNGPNNVKQAFEMFTNNGVLNSFYAVLETPPGGTYTIRISNMASVEFPAYAYIAPVMNVVEDAMTF